jgi:hypothetical protein
VRSGFAETRYPVPLGARSPNIAEVAFELAGTELGGKIGRKRAVLRSPGDVAAFVDAASFTSVSHGSLRAASRRERAAAMSPSPRRQNFGKSPE